ncbi:MAG: hypothetical protein ACSHX8_14965 [Opitutaceae bacterium]
MNTPLSPFKNRLQKPLYVTLAILTPLLASAEAWTVDSQADWMSNQAEQTNLEFKDGMATPTGQSATFKSTLKSFKEKRSAQSITITQSPVWQNWQPTKHVGPTNLGDAPVFLSLGEGNYWIFGRYGNPKVKKDAPAFVAASAELEGFDIPLKTTPFPNQYDAPGGLEPQQGGYNAWQSRDMINWVNHGSITDTQGKWMTTAEYVDGKAYFYYDFPNDQDPHLIIDDDLTDGKVGKKMGMAFKDPSHGSDSAIIRDLEGKFHLIVENWDPISANKRSWDSPLASHAVSENGIDQFQLLDPAVDYRTNPTGKIGTYKHPHWVKEDPANYKTRVAKYEIHEPEQDAYGDWAAISVGGQYYLFGDFDPAGAHGSKNMSVAWFTASSINEPFTFCGNVGKGHPDPDIMFAEGQFYLVTQHEDFVSPGPWVEGVEVRVGVDTNKDGKVNQWSEWQAVNEGYDYVPGFAKQVAKTPAQLDLSLLPEGYGFQYEIRIEDTTENISKPILDQVQVQFK